MLALKVGCLIWQSMYLHVSWHHYLLCAYIYICIHIAICRSYRKWGKLDMEETWHGDMQGDMGGGGGGGGHRECGGRRTNKTRML